MNVQNWILLTTLAFAGCGSNIGNSNSTAADTSRPVIANNIATKSMDSNEKLIGVWTDGSTENASIEIGRDSIFYVDRLASYPYSVDSNTISIKYSDFVYKALVSWRQDTLVFTDQDGVPTKLTRFRN
jgi:hypothetical protein